MSAVITRRVRTSQPSGCVIAASDWRALGLQNLTMFGAADIDAANPVGFTRSGTGHTLKANAFGVGVSQNGGNNTWTVGAKGKTIGVGNQFAVVVAFQLNATGQTQKYLVMDGASADQTAIIYGYVANTVEFFAQGYTGTDPRTGSGIVVNDTLPHVIIYTYDGTNWRGYLDGVEKFSVTRTFSLFGLAGTPSGFIGGATATGGVINATFNLHARFSAGLPRTAALRISANQWQLFKPNLRRIWMPFPATGSILTATSVEALSGSESNSNALLAAASLNDSLSALELPAALAAYAASRQESVAASDAATASAAYKATAADSVATSDAVQALAQWAAQASDTGSANDNTYTGASAAQATAAETVSAADAGTATTAGTASVTNSINASDTTSAAVQYLSSLLDGLSVTDQQFVGGSVYVASNGELVSSAEVVSAGANIASAQAETVISADQIAAFLAGNLPPANIDPNLVPKTRWISFEGNTRVVVFEGTSRVVVYEGNSRVVTFEGNNRTVVFQ
jgi:hypothetical protein